MTYIVDTRHWRRCKAEVENSGNRMGESAMKVPNRTQDAFVPSTCGLQLVSIHEFQLAVICLE